MKCKFVTRLSSIRNEEKEKVAAEGGHTWLLGTYAATVFEKLSLQPRALG